MESLRGLSFLNDTCNDICSFNDDEYIKDLDRQTMIILWTQIKLCFYRIHMNDLLYNGHTLASPEILELSWAMDKLMMVETNANNQYKESQRIINSRGQL